MNTSPLNKSSANFTKKELQDVKSIPKKDFTKTVLRLTPGNVCRTCDMNGPSR